MRLHSTLATQNRGKPCWRRSLHAPSHARSKAWARKGGNRPGDDGPAAAAGVLSVVHHAEKVALPPGLSDHQGGLAHHVGGAVVQQALRRQPVPACPSCTQTA